MDHLLNKRVSSFVKQIVETSNSYMTGSGR